MARIIKEPAVRRNEILDVAQRLVYTKGYEQMTIQDILDDLRLSKGAFYHYFDSKQALMEALVERMLNEAQRLLLPIVQAPHLPALDKLQRFFDTLGRWKTAQKTFILELVRVLYTDDNAIFRQKLRTTGIKWITPLFMPIIYQGIQEGVLMISYPEQIGEVVLSLVLDFGDIFAELLLSFEPERDTLQRLERTVAAFTDAVERVLGAPPGSLSLVDDETLKEWVVSPRDNEAKTQS